MAAPASAKQKLPFGLKLKAWWEGYDAADLAARLAPREEPAPRKREPVLTPSPEEAIIVTPVTAYEAVGDVWDSDKVSVAELIWGEGYCGPGGPDYVIAMSKLLAMGPEMSMLHLGAGLGGPARTLAQEFGVWVTGFEESQILVDKGNELSRMAGLGRKAELKLLSGEEKPFDRKFDRVLATNFFLYHDDKEDLVSKIHEALKPDSLVLITDLFLAEDAMVATDGYRDWRSGEPRTPSPCTHGELAKMLADNGFIVRVDDDLSAEFISLITNCWSAAGRVVADVRSDPARAHLAQVILREGEVWQRRLAMLKSHRLVFHRILAARGAQR